MIPENPEERPRAIAFSPDGMTAYVGCFGVTDYPVCQKFVNKGSVLKLVIQQVDPINFPAISAYVSVQTQAGAPVENLTASNFKVWEDGTEESPITVTPFGGGDRANISILMDYSGSMSAADKINMETAARTFVGLMGSQDQGAIFKFGSVVQKKQGLTTDKNLLYQAITSSAAGCGGYQNRPEIE